MGAVEGGTNILPVEEADAGSANELFQKGYRTVRQAAH